ncbi:MAG: hypothetical protein ACE15E_24010 [Acidobacteriota bacterium]
MSGQIAPTGGYYQWFDRLTTNNIDTVAFTAGLSGETHQAVFVFDGKQVTRVVFVGEALPGNLGVIERLGRMAVGRDGSLVVIASTSSGETGVFSVKSGVIVPLLMGSDHSLSFGPDSEIIMDSSGSVVFTASSNQTSGLLSVFSFANGQLQVILKNGEKIASRTMQGPHILKSALPGVLHFVDSEFVGPVAAFAPAALCRVATDGSAAALLLDQKSQSTGSPFKIKVGSPGRGIRDFDIAADGTMVVAVDVESQQERQEAYLVQDGTLGRGSLPEAGTFRLLSQVRLAQDWVLALGAEDRNGMITKKLIAWDKTGTTAKRVLLTSGDVRSGIRIQDLRSIGLTSDTIYCLGKGTNNEERSVEFVYSIPVN